MRAGRGIPASARARRAAAALLPVALALAPAASPSTQVLRLDAVACRVRFSLEATLHEVEGVFALREGMITFDPVTGEASGRVVVATASGKTHNDKRDRKMHGKVLESGLFPEIVFVPDRVEGTFLPAGDSEVRIGGVMEIHGARHEVVIPARVHVENGRLTGAAALTVPYVAWGMKDPSVLMFRVAKEVVVSLDLAGTVETAAGPAPVPTDGRPAGLTAGRPAP